MHRHAVVQGPPGRDGCHGKQRAAGPRENRPLDIADLAVRVGDGRRRLLDALSRGMVTWQTQVRLV